jgi:hypothetical protein
MHSHAGHIPKLDKKKGFFGNVKASRHHPAGSKGSQIRQHYNTIPNSTALQNRLHDITRQKVDIIRSRHRTNITRSRNWQTRLNHTRTSPERTSEPPDGESDNNNETKDETDIKENTEVERVPTDTTPVEKNVDTAAVTDSSITIDNEENKNIDETKDKTDADDNSEEAEPTRPVEKTIDGVDANGDTESPIPDESEADPNIDETKDKTNADDNSEESEANHPAEKTIGDLAANGDADSAITDGNKDDPNSDNTKDKTDVNENTEEAEPIPIATPTRPAEENTKQIPEWKDIKVTRTDGVQFTVLKQMDHDASSFTYVLRFSVGVQTLILQ